MEEYLDSEFGISDERALSLLALKTKKAGQHDELVHAAAIRIQSKFRSWKRRKDFLLILQRIIQIQAHVRGHQLRKNYRKIIWSDGSLDEVILLSRRKGIGLSRFKPEALGAGSIRMVDTETKEDDYDFLKVSRKQTEERLNKALFGVKSMVQYPEARDQYRELLNVVSEMQETKIMPLSSPSSFAPTTTSEEIYRPEEIFWAKDVSTDREMPVDIILEKEGYLRDCILYCSLFPADYEFTRDALIWSWLAAGLINSEQNGIREAVAIRCFDELIRSNFICHSGYDHLADQMRYKLGNEENIFLNNESLDLRYRISLEIDTDVTELEHLSLIFEGIDQIHFEILPKCGRLKTLLLHQCYSSKLENLLNDLFLELKILTTLDLSCTNIVELPSSIENLKALQYLDMSKTHIRRLPESLDSVGSLETLILMECLSLCGLPKCTNKLINLQHLVLDISRQLHSMPIGIGKLTNLQTLCTFLVGTKEGNRIGELRNMNRLKGSLSIMKLENVTNKEEAEKHFFVIKTTLQN